MCGYYTGETVGCIVYYAVQWNIVTSMSKLPEQKNWPSKKVGLFDRYIRLCTVLDIVQYNNN